MPECLQRSDMLQGFHWLPIISTIESAVPNGFGARRAEWGSSCHSPSTMNRYAYRPGGRGISVDHFPSIFFTKLTGCFSQSVKSAASFTEAALGAARRNSVAVNSRLDPLFFEAEVLPVAGDGAAFAAPTSGLPAEHKLFFVDFCCVACIRNWFVALEVIVWVGLKFPCVVGASICAAIWNKVGLPDPVVATPRIFNKRLTRMLAGNCGAN